MLNEIIKYNIIDYRVFGNTFACKDAKKISYYWLKILKLFIDMQLYSKILQQWYTENKRDLPWRDVNDVYKIWISEIILQQTRVNQGLEYYLQFIQRFPDVKSLALAPEDDVLKNWQGLGYYSRARNLHKAAKQVFERFEGVFPSQYADVLSLSGIGAYTAAAICSIVYNQPYAVVDGNVYRVLSRLFAVDTPIDSSAGIKQFSSIAQDLLDKKNPSLHNQAVMEFGALQCVPVSPNCSICPLQLECKAFQTESQTQFPVKTQKVKVKERFFNYIMIEYNQSVFLQKRISNDIWRNLFEFPLIETDKLLSRNDLLNHPQFKELLEGIKIFDIQSISKSFRHILTHRIINAQFFKISISDKNKELSNYLEIPISNIHNYAVSRLIELYLESESI